MSSGSQQSATAADPFTTALPIYSDQALAHDDNALRLASTSDLELEASGKPISLREFSRGKELSDLPCLVKVADGHRSLCEMYSFGQEQMFVVLEKKSMLVVTCKDQVDGSSYAIPLSTTAFDLIPYWMDAEGIRPNSFAKITANELLQSKALPPVIAVSGEFECSEHSKKTVPVGTLLFLKEEKKQVKDQQRGVLHAKSESGEMVQITPDCKGCFSILADDVRLSLQQALSHLTPPFTMRTISDCDTLYVNVITVERVQEEEVVVGMMKATEGTTIDNVASFSRTAEVPVNLNLTVVSMVPKEQKTLEHIYDYAHTGYYGVMRRPTMDISNPPRTVATIPNPSYLEFTEGQVQAKLSADTTSSGQPAIRQRPTPMARKLPTILPQASARSVVKEEHIYDCIPAKAMDTVEVGDNFSTTSKVKEPTSSGEAPTCKGETHASEDEVLTSKDEPLTSKVEAVASIDESRTSEDETSISMSKAKTPKSKEEVQNSIDEISSSLTDKADTRRHEAPTYNKEVPTRDVHVPTFIGEDPASRHQDAQKDTEANIAFLKTMQRGDVLQLLDAMNLSVYKDAFEQEQIDGDIMACLNEEMLSELGVSRSLHRLRLLKIITGRTSAKAAMQETHHI